MANSPIIFGPNNTAINLQNQTLLANGELIANNGPRNLITYNNFENGLTTGWSLGTTGTLTNGLPTGTPTFGSGASADLSIDAASTTPISGNFSLSYVSSAATTAGNMLHTDALTVQPDLQAKVLTFKFNYQAFANASNGNFSGTSSNSFGVAVWDVTNSSWLIPAGAFAMTQNSGVGVATGTFQTNANTASIRFVVYNANATAGAITMYFDDFSLGSQTAPIGPVITDTVSFTPTGSWVSNTTYTGSGWRTGDKWNMVVNLALSGAPTSATLTINLPNGWQIDTTKLPTGSATNRYLMGFGSANNGSTQYELRPRIASTTTIELAVLGQANTYIDQPAVVTQAVPFTFANTHFVNATILQIPIAGWSSNVQMSNDTDTRVVVARASDTSGTSITTTPTVINFGTVGIDNTASITTGASWNFKAPITGYYRVSAQITISAATIVQYGLQLRKNGTVFASGFATRQATNNAAECPTVNDVVQLNAGDTIDALISINTGSSTLGTAVGSNFISIERITGPSVIAASESVTGRYVSCASSINGSFSDLTYTTKDWDSHNAYSGATWTCPVSGKYTFTARMVTSAASAHIAFVQILKNGVAVTTTSQPSNASGAFTDVQIIDDISCLAGDTIKIQGGDTGTTPSIQTSAIRNTFSWKRVGN